MKGCTTMFWVVEINYIKTSGSPKGRPSQRECAIEYHDGVAKRYVEKNGAWSDPYPINPGDRFIFMESGADTSGDSGNYMNTNNIYLWDGNNMVVRHPEPGEMVILKNLYENSFEVCR